ncbi:MAG: vWA domain-containing protein [bacterium]
MTSPIMRRTCAALFSTLLLALPAKLAQADPPACTPPQLLIILDKSSSMTDPPAAGMDSKWTIATQAITQLTANYGGAIDLGLMIFPDPNQCSPGSVVVDVGPSTASAIVSALGSPPPSGGNYTPMAQSIAVAASYAPLLDPNRYNYVVLITDGWQWCDPYDPATRFLPVQAAASLAALGITTYVVGFGDGVDVLTLNRTAVSAGTQLPGCDETSSDPTNPDNCYFQADDLTELTAALDQIGMSVSQEVCDGVDNNCDGQIDEGLSRSCSTACGFGAETCVAGVWTGCTAQQPVAEICDGLDNDCNDIVDEGCACLAGETMPCGSTEGLCEQGEQQCINGQWSNCIGGVSASAEVCDGLDNDCDGEVDEGLHQGCSTACGPGEEICIDGGWTGCTSPLPTGEICDALDNDCDGEVDNGAALCGLNAECINGSCVPVETPGSDAGIGDDSGTGQATAPDTCGCAKANGGPGEPLGVFLLTLLVLLAIRRRR